MIRRLLAMFFAAACALQLLADDGASSQNVSVSVWRSQDGLPDQAVQAIVEDQLGYLWLGTPSGLIQFDGATFTKYSGSGSDALSNGVISLLSASDGSLYVGTEGGGLVRIHDGKAVVFGSEQGLANPIVRSLLEDNQHRIWAGTDYGLFVSDGHKFTSGWKSDVRVHIGAAALFEDADRNLWVGTSALIKMQGDKREIIPLPGPNVSTRFKAVGADSHGGILAGDDSGVVSVVAGKSAKRLINSPAGIRCFTRMPAGQMLLCTASGGAFIQTAEGKFQPAAFNPLMPSPSIRCGYKDRHNQTWLGTEAGLVRITASAVHLLRLPSNDFGTVSRDGDGTLWWASGKLLHDKHGQVSEVQLPSMKRVPVRSVFRAKDGALWVGTAGQGVVRFAPGTSKPQHLTEGVGVSYIRGFLQEKDGGVWIATDGGISLWKDGRISDFQKLANAPHTEVLSLAEDASRTLWVGTRRGLYSFRNGAFEFVSSSMHLPTSPVWSLLLDRDNNLWAGTNVGLFLRSNESFHRVPLPSVIRDSAVYSILQGAGDLVWVAGPTAVASLPAKSISSSPDKRNGNSETHVYSITTALPVVRLLSGLLPSGVMTPDGPWYPSSEGPIHISASVVTPTATPRMMLTRILINGRSAAPAQSITLKPDTQTLQIGFAPLQIEQQIGMQFRHRLTPLEEWSAPSSELQATYTNLPAGSYAFDVEALDINGHLLDTLHLQVKQQAAFYQRIWFWISCGFLLGALGLAFHRLRMRTAQRRFAAVTAERTRLAREMHDTLIQGCTAVSALLEAVSGNESFSENGDQWLTAAREQVKTTIVEARAAVWDLRTKENTLSLEQTLRKMASEVSQIETLFSKEGAVPDLPANTTHELVMCAREALINSTLHSRANRIQIHLRCDNGAVEIEVADNGHGFLADHSTQFSGHFGLTGMKERMQRIGGRCTVRTDETTGTSVRLVYTGPHKN